MNGTLVSPQLTKKGLWEKINRGDHNLTRYQMIHNAHCMLLGLASERLLQVVTCSKVLASRAGLCDEGAWLKKYLVKRVLTNPSIRIMRGKEDISISDNETYEGLYSPVTIS